MDEITKTGRYLFNSLMPLIILCLLSLLAWWGGVGDLMDGDSVREELSSLQYYADVHFNVSLFLFFVSGVFFGAMGWPRIYILALLGGFLFGPIPGAITLVAGITLGSLIFNRVVRGGIEKNLNFQIPYGLWVLSALRLIPFIPFGVTTLLSAGLTLSARRYLLVTFFGTLPWVSFVSLMGGASLESVKIPETAFASFLGSTAAIVFSVVALLALATVILKIVLKKVSFQVAS